MSEMMGWRVLRTASARWVRWAVPLAIAVGLVFGSSVGSAWAAEDDGDIDVVLLGDSFSAGNGAGDYFPDFEHCHRSFSNWASQYVDMLREDGLEVSFAQVNNAACSGAETVDVIDSQVHAISDETDLVVLTMGGNDGSAFSSVVTYCFFLRLPQEALSGVVAAPYACESAIDRAKDAAADSDDLQASIEEALFSIRDQGLAPDAQVVLLAYPYLDLADDYFGVYPVGQEVRALGDLGDQAQAAAVAAADAAGMNVIYLDSIKSKFAGHEPDGTPLVENPNRWLLLILRIGLWQR